MADTVREAKRELVATDKPDMQWRIIGGLLGLAVGFCSRKVLTFAWEKATGKKPPASADSPEIGLGEAIAYAVVMGLGMEIARIVVTRSAAKKWRSWKDAAREINP
ncbi:hypothetical protein GCM10010116_52910 [Microbispora rosea subsp. aerata]|nr:DUF4235 domain-containing protein [Microbispora rosea]GGO26380.1 hypothetical protein GCM10010116_52910 [Microbispora rosea subsp. aerata]GIH54208.1 hypothetical protein Mro02_11220 [Microbispora rosea subsp. aerata]GLJ83601.1 hypothetical protein GCM10017588_23290 [Microbispora rosea subsp. aerata]